MKMMKKVLFVCTALCLAASVMSCGQLLEAATKMEEENAKDTTAPAEVTLLTSEPGDKSVILTWQNPTDSDFYGAKISWGTQSNFSTAVGSDTAAGTKGESQTYTVTGLTNGTYYWFRVVAQDKTGNESKDVSIEQMAHKVATDAWNEAPVQMTAGTNGTAGTTATYVQFGNWPQTIKASSVTIVNTKQVEKNGYFVGDDGYYYGTVTTDSAVDDTYSFTNGAAVNGNTSYFFKIEPIKWRVLDNTDKTKVLIVAENVIGNCPFYLNEKTRTIDGATVYANNYKYSEVRAFLNNLDGTSYSVKDYSKYGFLGTAFTTTAQAKINDTLVDNSAASTRDYVGHNISCLEYCANTTDKVFLLSEFQVTNGVNYAADTVNTPLRRKVISDYARATGAMVCSTSDYYCWFWWTRSPEYMTGTDKGKTAYAVDYEGTAVNRGAFVDNDDAGVVPAMTINMSAE